MYLVFVLCFWVYECLCICENDIMTGDLILNGEKVPVAVSGGERIWGSVYNTTMQLSNNEKLIVCNKCVDSFSPDIFKKYVLLDKKLSFKVELGSAGCGCYMQFSLTPMPSIGADGKPDPTNCKDYSCDSNSTCGELCPEIDLFQANAYAMHITPHKCDSPKNQHYTKCDGNGCVKSLYDLFGPKAIGAGSSYHIDTLGLVELSYSFITENGKFAKLETKIVGSNGNKLDVVHDEKSCGVGYLESLTDVLKNGMVFVGYCGGTTAEAAKWLDVPPCSLSVDCRFGGGSIKDIEIIDL